MKILFVAAVLAACSNRWVLVHGNIEFTNLKCNSMDKSFLDFEYCFLKAVNRSYKYLSVKANLFQVPITEISVTTSLLKRTNGFKPMPFLQNITVDACKYLKSRDTYKAVKFLHNFFERYSNMNHTCPYDHDIFIEKLPISHINDIFGNILPLPNGEYQFVSIWRAYNITRANVKFQFVTA